MELHHQPEADRKLVAVIVRSVLSEESMRQVADRAGADEEPSEDLRALFRG